MPNRRLANLFIIVHLVLIAGYGLPATPVKEALLPYIQPYMVWSGLAQGWDMFSPDPLSTNFHLDAVVTLADGRQAVWTFPRMERLGSFERYQKERYRKWIERVRDEKFKDAWPDTARYIVRFHADDTANPPLAVALRRHWAPIPPPVPGQSYQPIPHEYHHLFHEEFFTYHVAPEDLR